MRTLAFRKPKYLKSFINCSTHFTVNNIPLRSISRRLPKNGHHTEKSLPTKIKSFIHTKYSYLAQIQYILSWHSNFQCSVNSKDAMTKSGIPLCCDRNKNGPIVVDPGLSIALIIIEHRYILLSSTSGHTKSLFDEKH